MSEHPQIVFHPAALAVVEIAAERQRRRESAPVFKPAVMPRMAVPDLVGVAVTSVTIPRPPRWWQITKRFA